MKIIEFKSENGINSALISAKEYDENTHLKLNGNIHILGNKINRKQVIHLGETKALSEHNFDCLKHSMGLSKDLTLKAFIEKLNETNSHLIMYYEEIS